MRIWLPLCLLVCLTNAGTILTSKQCHLLCHDETLHDHHLIAHCNCHHHRGTGELSAHTQSPSTTTAAPTRSTLSMCDYLCSIQQGGAACQCSSPVLPGRK